MIAFRDFVPRQLRAPRFGLTVEALQGEYETFEAAVAAMNAWLREAGVRVVSVETVVLPNIGASWEQGSTDPALAARADALWHQFVRVWYEDTAVSGANG